MLKMLDIFLWITRVHKTANLLTFHFIQFRLRPPLPTSTDLHQPPLPTSATDLHRPPPTCATDLRYRPPPTSATDLHRPPLPTSATNLRRPPPTSTTDLCYRPPPTSTYLRYRPPLPTSTDLRYRPPPTSATDLRYQPPPTSTDAPIYGLVVNAPICGLVVNALIYGLVIELEIFAMCNLSVLCMHSLMMREMWIILCSVEQECKWGCEEEGQRGMVLNVVWADGQKVLFFYLPGWVLVKIESQWYSAETHCDQGPGCHLLFREFATWWV